METTEYYLLAVEDREPSIVEVFDPEAQDAAIREQTRLEDERIAQGRAEPYYIVRPRDDALGLVNQALGRAPKPERRRRPSTRTVHGLTLVSQGDGRWVSITTDPTEPQVEIVYDDDFETECDAPHPVRFSKEFVRQYYETAACDRLRRFGTTIYLAMQDGRPGYYCEGGEIHFYGLWVVATSDGDVIARAETFKEALSHLDEYMKTGRVFA